MKIIDPEAKKTIEVNGAKIVIRPLRPGDQLKLFLMGRSINKSGKMKSVKIADLSRDDVTTLILPGIVSINIDLPEGHSLKGADVSELLPWMDTTDFWNIVNEVMFHTGMNEEEVKNSPSSSEQDTPESKDVAGAPVVKDEELVSTTPTK